MSKKCLICGVKQVDTSIELTSGGTTAYYCDECRQKKYECCGCKCEFSADEISPYTTHHPSPSIEIPAGFTTEYYCDECWEALTPKEKYLNVSAQQQEEKEFCLPYETTLIPWNDEVLVGVDVFDKEYNQLSSCSSSWHVGFSETLSDLETRLYLEAQRRAKQILRKNILDAITDEEGKLSQEKVDKITGLRDPDESKCLHCVKDPHTCEVRGAEKEHITGCGYFEEKAEIKNHLLDERPCGKCAKDPGSCETAGANEYVVVCGAFIHKNTAKKLIQTIANHLIGTLSWGGGYTEIELERALGKKNLSYDEIMDVPEEKRSTDCPVCKELTPPRSFIECTKCFTNACKSCSTLIEEEVGSKNHKYLWCCAKCTSEEK